MNHENGGSISSLPSRVMSKAYSLYNSWTTSKTNAKVPIAENSSNFSNNNAVNSYYLEDGSYFRMKNLLLVILCPHQF